VPPRGQNVKTVVSALLKWFAVNARDLPWRRTRDPYAIWVSEIMLQQTQVKTVVPYWERWMLALPNIRSLAKVSPQKIHKLWEGLGYYTRVRNMQRAAQVIVNEHDGKYPRDFDAVLALPGIGRYTAGAICSIAFNHPTPILDGNVIRVLTRLFGVKGDPREKKTNSKLWKIAEDLVKSVELRRGEDTAPYLCGGGWAPCPHRVDLGHVAPRASDRLPKREGQNRAHNTQGHRDCNCSHLNQSLMELGALICTPKNPRCSDCPVSSSCVARRKRIVHLLPNRPGRTPATSRRFFAFVINQNSRFLVRQRPAGVVNAHLWEFPNIEINGETDPTKIAKTALGFHPVSLKPTRTIKHTITRYRITLDVFHGFSNGNARPAKDSGCWLRRGELRTLPFSSAHKKILGDL
jgi:A/G-specific adenine glycosylase